jgi:hypothetical protein
MNTYDQGNFSGVMELPKVKPDIFFVRGEMRVGWVEQWRMRGVELVGVYSDGVRIGRYVAPFVLTTPQWSATMRMP